AWMMYQCLSDIPPAPSPANAENESNEHAHDLISQQKENGGDGYHDEDHCRGDGSFPPRRPRDLLRLDAHLLQELERTDLCHVVDLRPCRAGGRNLLRFRLVGRAGLRLAGVEGLEPPTPGFGDRCSSH